MVQTMKYNIIFFIKRVIKSILKITGINTNLIKLMIAHLKGNDYIFNLYNTKYEKNALIKYIVYPFFNNNRCEKHQNEWQVKEIARLIGVQGYNVDIVSFDSPFIKYRNKYDLLLDIVPGTNDVPKNFFNDSCKKIAYLTGMNPSIACKNEDSRLLALKKRRGVLLPRERVANMLTKDVEKYNAFFFIGNKYNLASYEEFNLPPVYFMRNNGYTFDKLDLSVKDSRSFVYFASYGQVHKGLDLLLDVFAQNDFPCELYICSCVLAEKEFCNCYNQELFSTNNIHTIGFVDVGSEKFWHIMSKCSYALLPSCSEATAGSVITCMSAGIIPIVSKECGFEDDEVINLPDCELTTIHDHIIEYSMKSSEWIKEKAQQVKYIADTNYSKTNFSKFFERSLKSVIDQ